MAENKVNTNYRGLNIRFILILVQPISKRFSCSQKSYTYAVFAHAYFGNGNQYEGPSKIPLLTQTIVASDSKQLSVFDLKNVSLSKSISFENNFPLGLDKHKNNAKIYDVKKSVRLILFNFRAYRLSGLLKTVPFNPSVPRGPF